MMDAMDAQIIEKIEEVRVQNNELWMNIVRIAVEKAPKETKAVMSKINENDLRIAELFRALSGTANDRPI